MGVWSMDYIPRGARFGPLVGEHRKPDITEATVSPAEASGAGGSCHSHCGGASSSTLGNELPCEPVWKIFSSSGSILIRLLNVSENRKSNWMKFVNRARTKDSQNLVACQVNFNFPENPSVHKVESQGSHPRVASLIDGIK